MPISPRNLFLALPVIVPALFGELAFALPQVQYNHNNAVVTPSGLGLVKVINTCTFEVESNIVHAPRPGINGSPEEIKSTLRPGAEVTHPFSHDPNMGISWKLVHGNAGPVQFEWTWVPGEKRTYWDLSMIDAQVDKKTADVADVGGIEHAFAKHGISLRLKSGPIDVTPAEGGSNCLPISCPKGSPVCHKAYNTWDDWSRQHDCGEHVSLVLTLCK